MKRDQEEERATEESVASEKERKAYVAHAEKLEEDGMKFLAAEASAKRAMRKEVKEAKRPQREKAAAARYKKAAEAADAAALDKENDEALMKAYAARDRAPPAVSTLSRTEQEKKQKRARSEHAAELRMRSPLRFVSVPSSGVRQTKRQRNAARAAAAAGSHGECDDSGGEVREAHRGGHSFRPP